jgi:hypothetical protein
MYQLEAHMGFLKYIDKGDLESLKKLYYEDLDNEHQINIHTRNEFPFRLSCSSGHIEIAEWLWEISLEKKSPINIHALSEDAFIMSCRYNQLKSAQWLWNFSHDIKSSVNLSIMDDQAFKISCYLKHMDIINWLCEICPRYSYNVEKNGKINSIIKHERELNLKLYDENDIISL